MIRRRVLIGQPASLNRSVGGDAGSLGGVESSVGGQVFLTTTQPSLIRLDVERRDFAVRSGTVAASSDSSSATQVGSD